MKINIVVSISPFFFLPLLSLPSAGVVDPLSSGVILGLLPQTCLLFGAPDLRLLCLFPYHASSSLPKSTDDLLDEALLEPRLEHRDEESLYVCLLFLSTLPAGLGGRSKFSVEFVRERGSFPLLK